MLEIPKRTWCEINLKAIANNLAQIRNKIGKQRNLITVIKADAYGHGVLEVAKLAQKVNPKYLGLATYDEAVALRQKGVKTPILVLSCCQTNEIDAVIEYRLTPNICDLKVGIKLSAAAIKHKLKFDFHTEIDTGIGRVGAYFPEASNVIQKLTHLPNIKLQGVFTHFASADDDRNFTFLQFKRYQRVITELHQNGVTVPFRHVANSASVLAYPELYLDGARPGLIIYGLYPASVMRRKAKLIEAMSLKSRVIYIKHALPGRTVSYGQTYTTKRNTIIATVSAGYRNGYPRLLSNQGEVLIHEKRVPVIGRICMDQLMVDATKIPNIKLGDEVVLFGKQNKEYIGIDEVAKKASTISYEIICSVGRLNNRIYI